MISNAPSSTSVDESEFLAGQADSAKNASFAALNDAKAAFQQSLDPRPALKKHPLIAIGSAALVGFVTALFTVRSKREEELRRLELLHLAANPQASSQASGKGHGKPSEPVSSSHSVWSSIIHEVVQLIRPVLLTAITAGIKSATNPPPPSPEVETPGVQP